MSKELLNAQNIKVTFKGRNQEVYAVRGVDIKVNRGEILGVVGESGSGKSVLMKSIMGLLPENAVVNGESVMFNGADLLKYDEKEMRKIRGKEISMIFQDPMTALNPLRKIGYHVGEILMRHKGYSKKEAQQKAVDVLRMVSISNPEKRVKQYPHEFSGGMRQRVLIGMALSCEPKLLIADEPTTALDVSIQAQILDLLKDLQRDIQMSIVLITHDMGVVANTCSRIMIMYGGMVMEEGLTDEIFYEPKHPYTKALLRAIPTMERKEGERLQYIDGVPPALTSKTMGCPFADRCDFTKDICRQGVPDFQSFSETHKARCFCMENREDR